MLNLLKNVYLLDNKKIKKDIERLWDRYQSILVKQNCSWGDANEARAILYFLGHIFAENIALGSLERRMMYIKPKISIDNFLLAIDRNDEKVLNKYKKNINFNKLKEFYLTVKSIKNKVNQDSTYLDEETFNKKYNKLKPKTYF